MPSTCHHQRGGIQGRRGHATLASAGSGCAPWGWGRAPVSPSSLPCVPCPGMAQLTQGQQGARRAPRPWAGQDTPFLTRCATGRGVCRPVEFCPWRRHGRPGRVLTISLVRPVQHGCAALGHSSHKFISGRQSGEASPRVGRPRPARSCCLAPELLLPAVSLLFQCPRVPGSQQHE